MEVITPEEAEETLEAFESVIPKLTWRVVGKDGNGNDFARDYIQEELSFFGKARFTTYMTKTLKGITDEHMLTLGQIWNQGTSLEIPNLDPSQKMSADEIDEQFAKYKDFIGAMLHVIELAPDFLEGLYPIILGIPRHEAAWAMDVITGPVHRGGLNDDQGFLVLNTFVEQNAVTIRDFFAQRGREFVATVVKVFSIDTPGSTPSSTSAPDTDSTPETSVFGQPGDSSFSTEPSHDESE